MAQASLINHKVEPATQSFCRILFAETGDIQIFAGHMMFPNSGQLCTRPSVPRFSPSPGPLHDEFAVLGSTVYRKMSSNTNQFCNKAARCSCLRNSGGGGFRFTSDASIRYLMKSGPISYLAGFPLDYRYEHIERAEALLRR